VAKKKRNSSILSFGVRGDNLNSALNSAGGSGEVQVDDGHIRWSDLRNAISSALQQHPEALAALVQAIEGNFGIAPSTKISL
jgi:hypothetical protein